jgi:two-component system NtrC family sensor kinase
MTAMSTPSDQSVGPRDRLLAAYQQALGHELPNRLVAIQGLVQLLQLEEADKLGPEGREYLDQLAGLSRRAHELVRGLAEVGQAVRAAQATEPAEIADVAREAGTTVNQLYPHVCIEYHFSNPSPRLRVARPALYHVFVHLLRNAAHAAFGDQPLCIDVGGRDTSEGVEFWVADTGRGLTETERGRLFEPFAAGAQDEGETGLGMFLVSQLVEAWGGRLDVESTVGEGTTFRVRV